MWGIGITEGAVVFTIFVISILPLLAFLYLITRIGRSSKASALHTDEDQEALREVNRILESMERRIEALETILLDREARIQRTTEHD